MALLRLIIFWFFPAPDPRWGLAPDIARIVKADGHQIAFKQAAQVIAPAIEAELYATPIDCGLHLRRATKGKGDIGAAGILLDGHLI